MKLLTVALISIFFTSCIYEKEEIPTAPTNKTDQVYTGLGSAESDLVPFPHPVNFKEQLQHGSLYLKNKAACTKCHDDGTGTAAEVDTQMKGPSCSSCHSDYPHMGKGKDNWLGVHGKALMAKFDAYNPESNTCVNCHQGDLLEKSGNLTKVSCDSCHVQMPHDTMDWVYMRASGKHHADYLGLNGVNDCRKCHGKDIAQADVNDGNQGKAAMCSKCHAATPAQ